MNVHVELSLLTCPLQTLVSSQPYILDWDIETHKFVCIKNLAEYFTPFRILNIFTNTILMSGACLYLIIGKGVMDPTSISMDTLFITTVVLSLNWQVVGTNIIAYRHRFAVAEFANNWYSKARSNFFSEERPCKTITSIMEFVKAFISELKVMWKTGKGDYLGILLGGATFFTWISPVGTILVALAEKDYFSQAAMYMYPRELRSRVGDISVRVTATLLAALVAWEAARTLRVFYLQILVVVQVATKLVENVKRVFESHLNKALGEYQLLYFINNICLEPCAVILYLAAQTGSFTAILGCAGTSGGWKILTPRVYFMAPVLAASALFVMALALPMAEKTAIWSKYMIIGWRRDVALLKGRRALNNRLLRTLRPIGFPVSGYGLLDREFKTKLWYRVMDNTMDTCLMGLSA